MAGTAKRRDWRGRNESAPTGDFHARSRSTADAGQRVFLKKQKEMRHRDRRCLVRSIFTGASSWTENNARSAANPPPCGWKPISTVVTAPCCCVTTITVNWCASKSAPSRRWKPCSARAAACSRTSSTVTSFASATPRRRWPPIPMTWSMPRSASPPPQVQVRRAVAAVGSPAVSANSPRPYCRRPPDTLQSSGAPKSIPNTCCWRYPTAMW